MAKVTQKVTQRDQRMPAKKVATRFKFTAQGIKAKAETHHPKRIDYRDTATPGLQFRVGPRGAAWYYVRRIDGQLARIRLDAWRVMTLKGARERIGEIESEIEQGKDPRAEHARQRAEKVESRKLDHGRLIANLVKDWKASHFPTISARTQTDYQRVLTEFADAFGDQDCGKITRGQIIRHLDKIKARSQSQANRAAVVIRQLFGYALDRFDLPANPAANIKNPSKPKARKRTLNRQEIRVLWKACELAGYPYGHTLRFALCTGQRIGEIGFMRWRDIEGEYWANSETKTDQRIDIYLADQARAILEDCPRIGDYVFTHGRAGLRSDTWGGGASGAIARHIAPRIEQAAGALKAEPITEHWTPHDLRRTVRTGLTGWAGVLPDTAERVLNHSIGGLRAHYDFADYRPHVTEALKAWDAELSRILAGEQAAVTPIRREAV
jgi:integrase